MKKILIFCILAVSAGAAIAAAPKKGARKPAANAETLAREGQDAVLSYDLEGLENVIESWEKILKKNAEPAALRSLRNRSIAISNMLGRVEKITILDWLTVDSAEFFSHYRLSADAGKIGGTGRLTSFTPASGTEVFYTAEDSVGVLGIMHADILDDGTRVTPRAINLGTESGSDSAYPFMAADGTTLYFANNADNDASLGGYDIYMTRRDEKGDFLEPVNLGMPYNSPGNDYLYVMDEGTGLGWWATDRAAAPGQVSIFVFIPNNGTRVNYDADKEDIVDVAFISSVKDTWPEGFDPEPYNEILEKATAEKQSADGRAFSPISLGNGTVYTSASQFRASGSQQLLQSYLAAVNDFKSQQKELDAMRDDFGAGNIALRDKILAAERRLEGLRRTAAQRLNALIKNETKR